MMGRTSLVGALVSQGVVVIIGLLVAFGLPITSEQTAAIMAAAGFAGLILTLVIWASTVPSEEVVERLIGDAVVAGEANDLVPSGAEVRLAGQSPEHAAVDPYAASEETQRMIDAQRDA